MTSEGQEAAKARSLRELRAALTERRQEPNGFGSLHRLALALDDFAEHWLLALANGAGGAQAEPVKPTWKTPQESADAIWTAQGNRADIGWLEVIRRDRREVAEFVRKERAASVYDTLSAVAVDAFCDRILAALERR